MTRTLVAAGDTSETQFVTRKRRRTKEEVEAAKAEVAAALANAPQAVEQAEEIHPESIGAVRITDDHPLPPIDTNFQAHTIEFHQPVEIMANQKTLSASRSTMTRLADGTGDWLVQSKKTKNRYLLGAGNIKAVRLK